jgi:paired amphipathic helix protein Sin3a
MDRHTEELAIREARERELHERRQQEQAAHEHHAGAMQLHQPVAVAPPVRTIHGPNGLLGGSGPMASANSLAPSSSGQGGLYGGVSSQQAEGTPRMQHASQTAQQLLPPFNSQNMAQNQLGLGQGQQPILNVSDLLHMIKQASPGTYRLTLLL